MDRPPNRILTVFLFLLSACDESKLPDGTWPDTASDCDPADTKLWYADVDGDGHGDASDVVESCEAPEGYVETGDDCDDLNQSAYELQVYYQDLDGDGYGLGALDAACGQPADSSEVDGDCDDSDSSVSPSAEPVCGDERDNNCDGLSDCDTLTGTLGPDDAGAVFDGDAGSAFGSSVAGLGDLDGDGLPDLGFGAPAELAGGGAAYVFLSPTAGQLKAGDARSRLYDSETFTDEVGTTLLGADLDNDGLQDVVITETGSNAQFIAYGPLQASQPLVNGTEVALLRWTGCGGYDHSVDAGDDLLYQDGQQELLIGCPEYDRGGADGAVAFVGGPIQRGSTSSYSVEDRLVDLLITANGGDSGQFGSYVSRAGDLDADGLPDLAVQAIWYTEESGKWPGRVFVFTDLSELDATVEAEDVALLALVGPEHLGGFGSSIAPAGDVDGDGYDDLLVGQQSYSPTASEVGLALVFSGATLSQQRGGAEAALDLYATRITGDATGDQAGAALAGLGDANGDGVHDIAIGAPGARSGRGGAFVWYSPLPTTATLAEADLSILGDEAGSQLGAALCSPGDVNGLGAGDLLVGAPGAEDGAGRAWLFPLDGL